MVYGAVYEHRFYCLHVWSCRAHKWCSYSIFLKRANIAIARLTRQQANEADLLTGRFERFMQKVRHAFDYIDEF